MLALSGTSRSCTAPGWLGTDTTRLVQSRPVALGPMVDGLRVVRTGLTAGELVVVNGLQRVRPGAQVNAAIVPMGGAQ